MARGIINLEIDVVKRAAGESCRTERGKVATPKGLVGNVLRAGSPVCEAESLVVKEEEGFVSAVVKMGNTHRAACSGTKVVISIKGPFQTRSVINPTFGVENAVPENIEIR